MVWVPDGIALAAVVNLLWAVPSRTTLFEGYQLAGGSMENTILKGDRVIAVKWTYGWRLPPFQNVLFGEREADRGDVVVFRSRRTAGAHS
jgi:signal peptidase I